MPAITIDGIIANILAAEGDTLTNDPSDSGGPTKYGITQNTLAEFLGRPASAEDVARLTQKTAEQIYTKKYVYAPGFDRIAAVAPRVAAELVDAGVMSGPRTPIAWLQRSLNVLNNRSEMYPDIAADGVIGSATIGALRSYLSVRGPTGEVVLLRALNCLQGEFLIGLAESREKDERFIYGWLSNRVAV